MEDEPDRVKVLRRVLIVHVALQDFELESRPKVLQTASRESGVGQRGQAR